MCEFKESEKAIFNQNKVYFPNEESIQKFRKELCFLFDYTLRLVEVFNYIHHNSIFIPNCYIYCLWQQESTIPIDIEEQVEVLMVRLRTHFTQVEIGQSENYRYIYISIKFN